jgi:hypothetical protein
MGQRRGAGQAHASAVDFDAQRSDADFLVEFSPEAPADLKRFFVGYA